MLDAMSNGRVDVGFGRGYQAGEYHAFNMDMDESRARFEEIPDMMRGLRTTDNYSHQGQFFTINDATLKPKPVQKPHPPIPMAVMRTPSSFQFALDNNYSFLLGNPYAHDPGIIEALSTYNRLMAEAGHMDIVNDSWALTKCFVHEDDDQAVKIPEASWESHVQNLIEHGTPSDRTAPCPRTISHITTFEPRWPTRRRSIRVTIPPSLSATPSAAESVSLR